jgi:hypothetical protein
VIAAPPLDLGSAPALRASREATLALNARLSAALAAAEFGPLHTLAAAGSLGRLEAGPDSDIDCLLVLGDHAVLAAVEQDALVGRLMAIFAAQGLKLPKAAGIFRTPITPAVLCAPAALGSLDEAPEVFGKRMQVLLDARPLYAPEAFRALRGAILDWYGTGFVARGERAQWTYLVNDLVRYLHSYAAWQQYKFDRGADDGWYLRQAKLRGSRMVTFAGLLCLLGAASVRRDDRRAWLEAALDLTPLERIALVMGPDDPAAFATLLAAYDRTHALLADPDVRKALVAASPAGWQTLPARHADEFAELHAATGVVLTTLTNFVLSRRGIWAQDFLNYLIF